MNFTARVKVLSDRNAAAFITFVVGATIAFLLNVGLLYLAVELAGVQGAANSIRYAIEQAGKNAPAQAAAPAPARRRGPDPDRNYTVNLAGAPSKGPDDAKITARQTAATLPAELLFAKASAEERRRYGLAELVSAADSAAEAMSASKELRAG